MAAVVNTSRTPSEKTATVCVPIASAEIAISAVAVALDGLASTTTQTARKAASTRTTSASAVVTRRGQVSSDAFRETIRPPRAAPVPKPASDAADLSTGGPAAPATPKPRSTMLPVMNAENTLSKASQLTASTAPVATVNPPAARRGFCARSGRRSSCDRVCRAEIRRSATTGAAGLRAQAAREIAGRAGAAAVGLAARASALRKPTVARFSVSGRVITTLLKVDSAAPSSGTKRTPGAT